MLFVIMLIIIICCIVKINNLKDEINDLKNEIYKLKQNDISNSNQSINDHFDFRTNDYDIKNNNTETQNIICDVAREFDNKNALIICIGAILVVISAIVFLMSTWNIVPNIIKTLVLFVLMFIFLIISKVSIKKYNLPKTSITFFYIAMAYLPICLISISIFGLLGEYLSISGDGNYIYLTLSSILTSIIYYLNYKKNNNQKMLFGSLIAQAATIVLFTLIFESQINLVIISLLLYNIILFLLTRNSDNKVFSIFYFAIPIISTIVIYPQFFINDLLLSIALMILGFNYLLLETKKSSRYTSILFNLSLVGAGIHMIFIYNIDIIKSIKLITSSIYITVIYITENMLFNKNKNLNFSYNLISYITVLIINICGISNINNYFILIGLNILFSIFYFINLLNGQYIYKYAVYSLFTITFYLIFKIIEISNDYLMLIPIVITLMVIFIENILKKFNDKSSNNFISIIEIVSYISIWLCSANNIAFLISYFFIY